MKTWKSILLNVAFIFASVFVPSIPNPALQKAAVGSLALIAASAAKKNSETDQAGNPLPPVK